jgi:predicted metal-dependent peptidase
METKGNSMETKQKIRRAIAGLVFDSPFFASIIMRQILKADTSCKTMYVDGTNLGYNPEFVDSLTLDELKGVLAHESLHLTNVHHARKGNREHEKWNVATDTSINAMVIASGFTLPKGALPGNNLSAEANYNLIPDPPKNENGSGNPDPGQCGEVREAKGENKTLSEAEIANIEAETRVMIAQAYQQAKSFGKVPAGMDRIVKDMLYPELDWKALLRRFLESNARNDYSWATPNRRFIGAGIYLPSVRNEELNSVIISVDTSGSLTDEQLTAFAAEISGILEAYPVTTHVIYCDSAVQAVETFDREDLPLTLNAKGGGGTSFIPPFAHVENENMVPNCLIYLTDGYCSRFPKNTPDYPVLWVTNHERFLPPFGEVVKLDNF